MTLYHKIDSIFMRDPANRHKTFLMGEWANPAFGYLANNEWIYTEKVDGTNIRVHIPEWTQEDAVTTDGIVFGGRTEEAQIPAKLVQRLQERFMVIEQRRLLAEMFPNGAVLYGEGYGAGIQAIGKDYRPNQDFVLFDVRVGDYWLERHNVEDVAERLSLPVAPIVGRGTLHDMIDFVMAGYDSLLHPGVPAEGVVARPATELCDRGGRRIITKLKHKDFPRR